VTAPAVGRYPVGNSAAALALAGIVGVALHELAHAVAGLVVGVTPTVYRSTVTYVPVPEVDGRIATAATGPLFSLVLGIVVFLTCRGVGRGFGRLFALWLGLVAMQNFYGYCLIAPIAAEGDSGIVLGLAGAPGWVYAVAVVIGVAGTLLNAQLFAGQVIRYGRDPDELRRLVLFPWLIGTGVLVAFDLLCLLVFTPGVSPGASVVVIAGSVAIAIFAPVFTFFYRRMTAPADPLALGRPVGPWIGVAVAAAIVLVVFAPGLRL
jgi:hypothetical protein